MAKLEKIIQGDMTRIAYEIETGVLAGSVTAHLEDSSDFWGENSRCCVRVFERYSMAGANRVSLSVTLYQENEGDIYLSAITSGGSEAAFFKINTIGENSFLQDFQGVLNQIINSNK